jgi:hypothetical protein
MKARSQPTNLEEHVVLDCSEPPANLAKGCVSWYMGVADLTAHKIPVAENVDKCHCKVARTGTDPKSSIVGTAPRLQKRCTKMDVRTFPGGARCTNFWWFRGVGPSDFFGFCVPRRRG